MDELYREDWATLRTLREADEGRRVSARRLREAEARREVLLGARGDQPRLQDAPQAQPEAMPAVATKTNTGLGESSSGSRRTTSGDAANTASISRGSGRAEVHRSCWKPGVLGESWNPHV